MSDIAKIIVVKRDGREERFSIEKLRKSVIKGLTYAGIPEMLDEIVDDVLFELSEKRDRKVWSAEIADRVEKALISRVVKDSRTELAAKALLLARIYNQVFGKGKWDRFDPVDEGLSYSALRVLISRYLLKDVKTFTLLETPSMLFRRVAKHIAKADRIHCLEKGNTEEVCNKLAAEMEEKYFRLMAERRFLPNSPTLMNAGTKLGILSACFVVPVRDAMTTPEGEGIYDAVRAQAIIFQQGGGTGFSFSEIRPQWDVVASTAGAASGPLSFMRIFDLNTDVIKQGGRRRGANMGILHVWHPDIMAFIKSKRGQSKMFQNFNISVGVYDWFFDALAEGRPVPLINPRLTSIDGSHDSRKYAVVWARHRISEEWVQEVIIEELEERGGSVPLDESVIITWDEALAIAEANGAIREWKDPAEIFEEIVKGAWESGDPGLIFVDEINRRHPTWYLGKINATNPCVSGDTRVLTPRGFLTAREVFERAKSNGVVVGVAVDEEVLGEGGEPVAYRTEVVTIAGGEPAYITSKGGALKLAVPKKVEAWVWYIGKKPALKVKTREGYEVTVTHEHKFLTPEGWKEAKDLKPGDKISVARLHPAFNAYEGSIDLDEDIAFALGWLFGDGTLNKHYVAWFFSKRDRAAEERVRRGIAKLGGNPLSHTYVLGESEHKVQYTAGTRVYKNVVSILGGIIDSGRERMFPDNVMRLSPRALAAFLRGLFTADGYVDNDKSVRLTSSSLELLKQVQVLLTLFGIYSMIYERPYEGRFHYMDKEGKARTYTAKDYYELVIKGYSRRLFGELIGFESIEKMEKLSLAELERDSVWATVEVVEDAGMTDFYDFTVPGYHNYVANGIVNHNCGEEPLLEWESCNLGSINLERYVVEKNGKTVIDWKRLARDVETAIRFLDNVITVAKYPLPQLEKAARRARKVGLGVMGWAHMLIRLGIRYDSVDAVVLANKLAEWIAYNAYRASIELAKERGPFPAWNPKLYRPFWRTARQVEKLLKVAGVDGEPSERVKEIIADRPEIDWDSIEEEMKSNGIRNATTLSIAPTGTISIIAGTSSSIEPIFALAFIRRVTVGEFIEINKLFLEDLRKFGLDEPEVVEAVAETGSIAHNVFMPRPLRHIYRTAHDIDPVWHVLHQASWQTYIDAAVSKTVNMRHEATVDEVRQVYLLAWALGCKGITVYRDRSKEAQVITFGVKELKRKEKQELKKLLKAKPTSLQKSEGPQIGAEHQSAGTPGGTLNPIKQVHVSEASAKTSRIRRLNVKVVLEEGDVGDCATCEY